MHVAVTYPTITSATLLPLGSGTISTNYIVPTPSYNIVGFATVMTPLQSLSSISLANPNVSPQNGSPNSPLTDQGGPYPGPSWNSSNTTYSSSTIYCQSGSAFDASTGSCTPASGSSGTGAIACLSGKWGWVQACGGTYSPCAPITYCVGYCNCTSSPPQVKIYFNQVFNTEEEDVIYPCYDQNGNQDGTMVYAYIYTCEY